MFLYNLSELAHISIPSMKFIKISYYNDSVKITEVVET